MDDRLVRVPLYEQLKHKLTEYIDREQIKYLPPEKELMQKYKVSRNTLRRAIYELTQENILRPIQGLGTLVYPLPIIAENSLILVICDHKINRFQQEGVNRLLYVMNKSHLNTLVLMIDKENVDIKHLDYLVKKCDGLVVDQLASFSPVLYDLIARYQKKAVCMRWIPSQPLSYITEDVTGGVYLLARHLLELGHRDIIFAGSLDDERRVAGLNKAFSEYGIELNENNVAYIHWGTRQEGYEATSKLLASRHKFTAVIALNDEAALGVEECLLGNGLRIPEDVSVTGFDNLEDSAVYPVPLTTASGNLENIISDVVAFLLSNQCHGDVICRVAETKLIVRKSTGAPPAKT
ncbi:MAG: GntR family transcriptional regulator [Victivallales bacterium]|nr:GntR family transcriptional regulator [Victivallales bacterium]